MQHIIERMAQHFFNDEIQLVFLESAEAFGEAYIMGLDVTERTLYVNVRALSELPVRRRMPLFFLTMAHEFGHWMDKQFVHRKVHSGKQIVTLLTEHDKDPSDEAAMQHAYALSPALVTDYLRMTVISEFQAFRLGREAVPRVLRPTYDEIARNGMQFYKNFRYRMRKS